MNLSIGEHRVVPLLLPGLVLTTALLAVIAKHDWDSFSRNVHLLARTIADGPTTGPATVLAALLGLAGLALYVVSLLSGIILAVLGGYCEAHALDRFRAMRMKITRAEFDRQWYEYVDDLSEASKNPYISNYVDTFLFTLRFALALLVAAVVSFVVEGVPVWASLSGLILFVLAFLAAVRDHADLAAFRRRRSAHVTEH
jgi:hypothetical protein